MGVIRTAWVFCAVVLRSFGPCWAEPQQPAPFDFLIEEVGNETLNVVDGVLPRIDRVDPFDTQDFGVFTATDEPGASSSASFQIEGRFLYSIEAGKLYLAMVIHDDAILDNDDLQVEVMVDIDHGGGAYGSPDRLHVAQRYVVPRMMEGTHADVAYLASNPGCAEQSAGSLRRSTVPYGIGERSRIDLELEILIHGHESCDEIGSRWYPATALHNELVLIGLDLSIVDADPGSWFRHVLSGKPASRHHADHFLRFWLMGDWEPPRPPSTITIAPWAELKGGLGGLEHR